MVTAPSSGRKSARFRTEGPPPHRHRRAVAQPSLALDHHRVSRRHLSPGNFHPSSRFQPRRHGNFARGPAVREKQHPSGVTLQQRLIGHPHSRTLRPHYPHVHQNARHHGMLVSREHRADFEGPQGGVHHRALVRHPGGALPAPFHSQADRGLPLPYIAVELPRKVRHRLHRSHIIDAQNGLSPGPHLAGFRHTFGHHPVDGGVHVGVLEVLLRHGKRRRGLAFRFPGHGKTALDQLFHGSELIVGGLFVLKEALAHGFFLVQRLEPGKVLFRPTEFHIGLLHRGALLFPGETGGQQVLPGHLHSFFQVRGVSAKEQRFARHDLVSLAHGDVFQHAVGAGRDQGKIFSPEISLHLHRIFKYPHLGSGRHHRHRRGKVHRGHLGLPGVGGRHKTHHTVPPQGQKNERRQGHDSFWHGHAPTLSSKSVRLRASPPVGKVLA